MLYPPDWAAQYIGTPYQEWGRSKDGSDCWFFCRTVLDEQFGITIDMEDIGYAHSADDDVEAAQRAAIAEKIGFYRSAMWREVRPGDEEPGDIIVFKYKSLPIHMGIVAIKGLMLHCEVGYNSVAAEYRGPSTRGRFWERRTEGFYRYAK